MSVLRDLDRLSGVVHAVATNDDDTTEEDGKRIEAGYEFVVKFNLGGLRRVEKELFFPWLRKLLPANSGESIMNQAVSKYEHIATLSDEIESTCKSLMDQCKDKSKSKSNQPAVNGDAVAVAVKAKSSRATTGQLFKIERLVGSIRSCILDLQHQQVSYNVQ